MSDKTFDKYMASLRDGERVEIVIPNGYTGASYENTSKVAKTLGHSFLEYAYLTDPETGLKCRTTEPVLCLELPFNRQIQHLVKKMGVPVNSNTVDELTGQPTGKSKGTSFSMPELQVFRALGLDETIEEAIKTRGGDHTSFVAMNKSLHETGEFSLKATRLLGGKVKSGQLISALLKGQNLDNNL